jgi:hypothetical protein
MQPYVIRQGDYLARLAYRFGFDADTVWSGPENEQLRQDGRLSQDPNILRPTDMLYIPVPNEPPVTHSLSTGTTNTFVADVPAVTVTVKFTDPALASQPYAVRELPELTSVTSAGDGTVTFSAPVLLRTATIVFADSGATFVCNIGHLDPIDSLTGVFQRLQHLGFIGDDATCDASDLELPRAALRAFKAAQAGAQDSSDPSNSQPPPSSGAASAEDHAGLNDDGTLDNATAKQLLAAHGS